MLPPNPAAAVSPSGAPVSIASPDPLEYPFGDTLPAPGELLEVAPGVHWLRMPLPFELNHINLWLLRDGEGWTIVDTGYGGGDETRVLWERIFDKYLEGKPVNRVLITHFHPDHFGLATWLSERWGVKVWISLGEFMAAHLVWSGGAAYRTNGMYRLFRAHGLSESYLDKMDMRRDAYQMGVPELPSYYRRVMDNEQIVIDGNAWQVIMGYGHAPEHAAYYCEKLKVMISGDMVLPRITTNISVWPTEPDGNPLQLFLDSTRRYRTLPAATLVLPSHGKAFRGLPIRAEALIAHHDARFEELRSALTTPKSAAEVVPVLFRRKMDERQMFFAMGEAIAHLNCLMYAGEIRRELGPDRVYRFALNR